MELLVPEIRVPALPMPSYVKLAMAFGVGAGTHLFDKSRYRSHGAITTATWADGLHSRCLDFDGSVPDYVLIPAAHTQLNFITEAFSIIARIRITDLTAHNIIFCRGFPNRDGYLFWINAGGHVQVYTYQFGAAQTSYTGAGEVVINTWYTVGLSRDGASIIMYKNGVAPAQTSAAHVDPLTCPRSAKIGLQDDLVSQPFYGKIEFLRIFGGIALTASEHLAWHNALA